MWPSDQIPGFHCRGHGLISGQGTKTPQTRNMAKNKITMKDYIAKFENLRKNGKSPDVTDQRTWIELKTYSSY